MAPQPHSEKFQNPQRPTWKEIRSLGYTMPVLDPQGHVCHHPVGRLFSSETHNPDASTPQRSRTSILRSILHDHTTMGPYFHRLLKHFISDDDPALVSKEEEDRQKAKFPKFMSLPLEIRQLIWIFAIPQRTLFYEAATHEGYDGAHGLRNLRLPMPMVAKACREARHVVMKLCLWVRMAPLPAQDDAISWCNNNHIGGFFFRDIDVVLFTSDAEFEPNISLNRLQAWTPESLMAETRTDMFAASWADLVEAGYLRCASQDRVVELAHLWKYVLQAGGKQNKPTRIYVQFNPVDNIIPLHVTREYNRLKGLNKTESVIREEVRFIVDLFDDAKLAELDYLNTVPWPKYFYMSEWVAPDDTGRAWISYSFHSCQACKNCKVRVRDREVSDLGDMTPRYAGCSYWPNKGLCFNCLRTVWEKQDKSLMLGFWLLIQWIDEFYVPEGESEAEQEVPDAEQLEGIAEEDTVPFREVFPDPRFPLRYQEEHPWVQERLLWAPQLRPVFTIRLSVHVEGEEGPRPDERSYPSEVPDDWAS